MKGFAQQCLRRLIAGRGAGRVEKEREFAAAADDDVVNLKKKKSTYPVMPVQCHVQFTVDVTFATVDKIRFAGSASLW